jgi:hypothetical protein
MLLYCSSLTGPDRYIPLFGQFQYNPAAAEDHPGGPQAASFLEQVTDAFDHHTVTVVVSTLASSLPCVYCRVGTISFAASPLHECSLRDTISASLPP